MLRWILHAQQQYTVRETLQTQMAGQGAHHFHRILVILSQVSGKKQFGQLAAVERELPFPHLLELAHDLKALPRIREIASEDFHHADHLRELRAGHDGHAIVSLLEAFHVDVALALERLADAGEAGRGWRLGENLATEKRAQVASFAD